MSEPDIDATSPLPLDRRSLLKRGAAAGALGIAAPITFDSFFSPAAACSGSGITSSLLGEIVSDVIGNLYTVTVTPTADTGLIFVIVNFLWRDPDSSTALSNTSGTPPTILVTDSIEGPMTEEAILLYEVVSSDAGGNAEGGAGAYLAVYSVAVTSTVSRAITVSLVDESIGGGDLALNETRNFLAHVVQLTADTTGDVIVLSSSTAAGGDGSPTVSVELPGPSTVPGDTSGELVVFGSYGAIRGLDSNPDVWPDIISPGGFVEVDDTFSNKGTSDLSLQTSFGQVAATGPLTNTQDTTPPLAPPLRAAAIALEINC